MAVKRGIYLPPKDHVGHCNFLPDRPSTFRSERSYHHHRLHSVCDIPAQTVYLSAEEETRHHNGTIAFFVLRILVPLTLETIWLPRPFSFVACKRCT